MHSLVSFSLGGSGSKIPKETFYGMQDLSQLIRKISKGMQDTPLLLPPCYVTGRGADITGTGRGLRCICLFSLLLAFSSSSVLCQGRPQALLAFQK